MVSVTDTIQWLLKSNKVFLFCQNKVIYLANIINENYTGSALTLLLNVEFLSKQIINGQETTRNRKIC